MRMTGAGLLLAAVGTVGCAGAPSANGAEPPAPTITVTSPDFVDGGRLPSRYTCYGAGQSPPLRWSDPPAGRPAGWAVIVTDPDAPNGTYTHWVLFDIPAPIHQLTAGTVPTSARQAQSSSGSAGYDPPCPPSGTHHYHFQVVGQRRPINLPNGAPHDPVMAQLSTESAAQGTLVATVPHA
jgi:Raf kinase inhibitor-like YbhB/YbcL family protein